MQEANLETISVIAGADLSSSQYFAVKINSSGQAVLAGAGEAAVGILQNKPESGKVANIAVGGVSFMKAGGVVTPGANVAADSAGKAKVAVANTTTVDGNAQSTVALLGSYVLGTALNTSNTADGDIFPVLITHRGAVPGTVS